MKTKRLIEDSISIDSAIDLIKSNQSYVYCWHPVKGKGGCLFELGGNCFNGILTLKAYIPKYDSTGMPVSYENGYIDSEFEIGDGWLNYKEVVSILPKEFDLIKFLKRTDFRKYSPKIVIKQATEVKDVKVVKL